MARTFGSTLSGLVLGSILSATIATTPFVTFWTYSVSFIHHLNENVYVFMVDCPFQCFAILSVVVLFFVRDRDRYTYPVSLGRDDGSLED